MHSMMHNYYLQEFDSAIFLLCGFNLDSNPHTYVVILLGTGQVAGNGKKLSMRAY